MKLTVNRFYGHLNVIRSVPVRDLMDPPIMISEDVALSKIISTLNETNSYDVFIQLSGKIGALTIRDIIGIKDIITTRPSLVGKIIPELNRDSVISEAARIMSLYRMRTLPIVHNGKIEGQVSAKRIVELISKHLVESKLRIVASNIMTSDPITIDCHKTVSAARSIMKRRRIDHLPVVDNA